ncbi:MAG: hypothetical protein KME47_09745 [Nodosilinea sp. WJT8-NPBG4]|jgi:hypothetical protein|nr:hypothetical protein [Nodosilinea sp. WJT8-NPBG4]
MNLFTSLATQIGVTDEVDTCSCCGKTNLKRTVVFETTQDWQGDGGDQFVFFGTTCATNAKSKAKKRFNDIRSKVNAEGLTESEQRDKAAREKVKVDYARFLVNRGHSLPEAWDIVRHIESQPNGVYRMATKLKLSAIA